MLTLGLGGRKGEWRVSVKTGNIDNITLFFTD